jgi:hypothetical protein
VVGVVAVVVVALMGVVVVALVGVVGVVAAVVDDALLPELPHAANATGMAIKQVAHHRPLRPVSVRPSALEDLISRFLLM